ncbi:MAG: c-type cytochrome [Chloroflexi bacterium]|nr:c-type cytochrome [Chloroflexota bacterium]
MLSGCSATPPRDTGQRLCSTVQFYETGQRGRPTAPASDTGLTARSMNSVQSGGQRRLSCARSRYNARRRQVVRSRRSPDPPRRPPQPTTAIVSILVSRERTPPPFTIEHARETRQPSRGKPNPRSCRSARVSAPTPGVPPGARRMMFLPPKGVAMQNGWKSSLALGSAVLMLLATACAPPAPPAAKAGGAPAAAKTGAAGSGAAAKVAGDAAAGKTLFTSKGCIACHVAAGVPGATGTVGPNLNGIGDPSKRPTLADGKPNTPENIKAWIKDPQSLKPGTLMPNLGLSDKEADDLTAFLLTLK